MAMRERRHQQDSRRAMTESAMTFAAIGIVCLGIAIWNVATGGDETGWWVRVVVPGALVAVGVTWLYAAVLALVWPPDRPLSMPIRADGVFVPTSLRRAHFSAAFCLLVVELLAAAAVPVVTILQQPAVLGSVRWWAGWLLLLTTAVLAAGTVLADHLPPGPVQNAPLMAWTDHMYRLLTEQSTRVRRRLSPDRGLPRDPDLAQAVTARLRTEVDNLRAAANQLRHRHLSSLARSEQAEKADGLERIAGEIDDAITRHRVPRASSERTYALLFARTLLKNETPTPVKRMGDPTD